VDDCVEGLVRLMCCDYQEGFNQGIDEPVTINQLVDLIADVAGNPIAKRHNLLGPQRVRGRNSDNRRLREFLGWEPSLVVATGTFAALSLDRGVTAQNRGSQ
jgi:GDP-D-mannose 3', 5'-epimerase